MRNLQKLVEVYLFSDILLKVIFDEILTCRQDFPQVYESRCLCINEFDWFFDAKIVACLHELLTMNKDR